MRVNKGFIPADVVVGQGRGGEARLRLGYFAERARLHARWRTSVLRQQLFQKGGHFVKRGSKRDARFCLGK